MLNKRVIINCNRDQYLIRWYLVRTKLIGIYLHKFIRSDEDRALHDHPWDFIVIPIWRGYFEYNQKGKRRVWPIIGSRFRRGDYQHRVELIKRGSKELSSWSIFIRFRKARDWGFYTPEGWIQWSKWWQDKCE